MRWMWLGGLRVRAVGDGERVARGGEQARRRRIDHGDAVGRDIAGGAEAGAVGDLKQILLGGRGAEHVVAEADGAAVVAGDVLLRRLPGAGARHHLPGDRIDGEVQCRSPAIQQRGARSSRSPAPAASLLQDDLGRRRLRRVGAGEPAERRLAERIAEDVVRLAIAAVRAPCARSPARRIGADRRRRADGEGLGEALPLRRRQQIAAEHGAGEVARARSAPRRRPRSDG